MAAASEHCSDRYAIWADGTKSQHGAVYEPGIDSPFTLSPADRELEEATGGYMTYLDIRRSHPDRPLAPQWTGMGA